MARRRRAERALVASAGTLESSESSSPSIPLIRAGIQWNALFRIFPILLSFVFFPVTCNATSGPHSIYAMPGGVTTIHVNHVHSVSDTQNTPRPTTSTGETRHTVNDFPVQMEVSVGFVARHEETELTDIDYVDDVPGVSLSDFLQGNAPRIEPPPPRFS